ncbi:MAG: hypothetical protein IPJ34_17870 [Myxococcales bacterium]|nr:hypothetical protein [Myxococcales bacterium]
MNLREDEIATAVERQVFRATAIGNLMEKVRSLSPPAPRDPSIPPSAGVPLVRGIFGEPGMPISITMPPQSGSPSNAPSERPKARRTRKPPAEVATTDLETTSAATSAATTDAASDAAGDASAVAKPQRRAKTKTAPPSESVVTSAPTSSEKPKSRPRKSRAAAPPEAPPDSAVTRIGSTLPEGALEDEAPKRSRRPRKAM